MKLQGISVIIATRNRSEPLRITLDTLQNQSLLPDEVLVVDSSDASDSQGLVEMLAKASPFPLIHISTVIRSAARQRNMGADIATKDLLVFMDDDVRLDRRFLEELVYPFSEDKDGRLAGVSGTIVNQIYSQPKGMNRLLLACCLGDFSPSWAGRLIGPAVNFLPQDIPDTIQHVEWLFSTGTAYRKNIFERYRFGEHFTGYSFAEDVHLSARIGRNYELKNTTRARFEHMDLGQHTHQDWRKLGESMVLNRRTVMVDVLGRKRLSDRIRLFAYEIVYCGLAMAVQGRFRPQQLKRISILLAGKLQAFIKVSEKA